MTQITLIVSKGLVFVSSTCASLPKDWFVSWLLLVALGGFCRFVGFHVKVVTDENNTIEIKVIKWRKKKYIYSILTE